MSKDKGGMIHTTNREIRNMIKEEGWCPKHGYPMPCAKCSSVAKKGRE